MVLAGLLFDLLYDICNVSLSKNVLKSFDFVKLK